MYTVSSLFVFNSPRTFWIRWTSATSCLARKKIYTVTNSAVTTATVPRTVVMSIKVSAIVICMLRSLRVQEIVCAEPLYEMLPLGALAFGHVERPDFLRDHFSLCDYTCFRCS